MHPASQQEHFDPYSSFNALPDFTLEAMTTVPGWTAAPLPQTNYTFAPPMQPQHHQNPYAHSVFDPNAAAYPFPAYDPAQQQNQQGMSGDMYGYPSHPQAGQQQQQQQQQAQGYGNWDMDSGNFGIGLSQAEQEELMQSLETDGMEDIQGIIETTLASITPKEPQGATFA